MGVPFEKAGNAKDRLIGDVERVCELIEHLDDESLRALLMAGSKLISEARAQLDKRYKERFGD